MTLIERITQAEMEHLTQYALSMGYLGPRTQCAQPAPAYVPSAWDACIPSDDDAPF